MRMLFCGKPRTQGTCRAFDPGRSCGGPVCPGDACLGSGFYRVGWLMSRNDLRHVVSILVAIAPLLGAAYKAQVRTWSLGFLTRHSDPFAHAANTTANRVFGVPTHEGAEKLTVSLISTFAKRFEASGIRLAVAVLPWSDDYTPQSRHGRAFVIEGLQAAHIPTMILVVPQLPNGRFDPQAVLTRLS